MYRTSALGQGGDHSPVIEHEGLSSLYLQSLLPHNVP